MKTLIVPPPLPATPDEWIRKSKKKRPIIDLVEDIHWNLLLGKSSEVYKRYLDAVDDRQSVEGTTEIDDVFAAQMVRAEAAKAEGHPLRNEKISDISRALKYVLNRYDQGRKYRLKLGHPANNGQSE